MKGIMVIRPYGYAIWENIQRLLDRRIKQTGHVNAYFPLFIPESFLQKEMQHLEGFAPEVAWVTQGGQEQLEGQDETIKILYLYKDFVESELAIPVIEGRKSPRERFAGAMETYAIEALMSDGKALQMGTSHNLGQHFSKVFEIRFEDREQKQQYVWQTSWGVSTRLIGALVVTHGDDSGLRIPPQVAPIQVVVVPISLGSWKENVLPVALAIEKELLDAGLRVKLDAREEFTPGWKFSEREMRGVPLRVEVGPKDIKEKRGAPGGRGVKKKEFVGLGGVGSAG